MFKIKLADTVIQIDNHFESVKLQCLDYISINEDAEFCISLSIKEIEEEGVDQYPLDYCESIAIYRKICQILITKNIFLLHGAFFTYLSNGILFIGPSGSGKSTQMKKWIRKAKSKIVVINGDKPLFYKKNGILTGFGTPWAGKERLNKNTSAELKAIFFVIQSDVSKINKISKNEAIPLILNQLFFPRYGDGNLILLHIVRDTLSHIPFFKFYTTLDENTVGDEINYLEKIIEGDKNEN